MLSGRSLFCLFKAIVFAVYITVIKRVMKSKPNCASEIDAETNGLAGACVAAKPRFYCRVPQHLQSSAMVN